MSSLSNTLISFKPRSLNEAEESKYGLSDDILNGVPSEESGEMENLPNEDDESIEPDPATDPSPDSPTGDDPTSPTIEEAEDGNYSDDEMNSEGDITEDEITSEAENAPGLRILSSISDKQYALCNLKLLDKFKLLINEISDVIENDIPSINAISDRENQILDIVHNNLSDMIVDLQNYILYTFSDTYESNVISYITFLKRYNIAIKILYRLKNVKRNDK